MMLQPSKFRYNTSQNSRRTLTFALCSLRYGNVALVLDSPFRISANNIFRLKLFLKRSSRNSDFTSRAFWVSIFPHLPLSRNAKGMRMGNGAGNLATWYTQLRGGKILVEFNNLRLGRAVHFANQVQHKLPVSSTILQTPTRNLNLVGARKLNPSLLSFW